MANCANGQSCNADGDCLAASYCSGGTTCAAKQANGTACTGANQCTSGNCVDGVCCDMACGGAQRACHAEGTVGTCSDVRIAFVSSQTFATAGAIMSVANGDAQCASMAAAAGIPGTFKAWLGSSTTSPSVSFTTPAVRYILVDGTKIADNSADLFDSSIDAVLNRTETNVVQAGALVWTGTNSNGTAAVNHCVNWSSSMSADLGVQGNSANIDGNWAAQVNSACNGAGGRIYCFEQ
jgi:hypothetical protein